MCGMIAGKQKLFDMTVNVNDVNMILPVIFFAPIRPHTHRARTNGPLLARQRLPVTFRCGQRAAARVPTWQKRLVRPADNGPAPACHQRPSTLFTQLSQHKYYLL